MFAILEVKALLKHSFVEAVLDIHPTLLHGGPELLSSTSEDHPMKTVVLVISGELRSLVFNADDPMKISGDTKPRYPGLIKHK